MSAAAQVSNAVLYEGYLLYPYYSASTKNFHRFQFGGLYPRAYTQANPGADRSEIQADFLVKGGNCLNVRFRALFLAEEAGEEDREFSFLLPVLTKTPRLELFRLGKVELGFSFTAQEIAPSLYRCTLRAANETECPGTERREILPFSLFSAHFLAETDGEFVSQIDPQDLAREAAGNRNLGLWPVLVGDEEKKNQLLAAPIILYDFPKIAPESRGDLFDGTEIDEILSLRVRTLTEEERKAVKESGEKAAALLERVDALSEDELLGMHGAWRASRPSWKPGDEVRINPKRKNGDIFDLALKGREATVEKIEETLEGEYLVAVTIDDDPGKDFGALGLPGHQFFFRPDELEPRHA